MFSKHGYIGTYIISKRIYVWVEHYHKINKNIHIKVILVIDIGTLKDSVYQKKFFPEKISLNSFNTFIFIYFKN